MKRNQRDIIAENIADYEVMKQGERGQLLVQILEDQPILMGFITNLADDFSESEHEALVDSAVILLNSFVAAGIPIEIIPHQMTEEVIKERLAVYEEAANSENGEILVKEVADSPLVFKDLRNRAFFKSDLMEKEAERRQSFSIALDTIIAIIERSASVQMEKQ